MAFFQRLHMRVAMLAWVAAIFAAVNLVSGQVVPGVPAPEETPAPEWGEDSLGRRTPRGTVSGFIEAVTDGDHRRAARFLHFEGSVRPVERERVVQAFQQLLDEGGDMMPYTWISDEYSGRENDDLPPGVDRVGEIDLDGESLVLTVKEIKNPDGAPVWLFSSETIQQIAGFRSGEQETLVGRLLPEWLKRDQWGGVPVGQWLVMFAVAILAYGVARIFTVLLLFLIRKLWRKAAREPVAGIVKAFGQPVRITIALMLFLASARALGISIILRQRFGDFTSAIGILALLLLLWRITDVVTGFLSRKKESTTSAAFFFRRLIKAVIFASGGIVVLASMGVDVTTGLAALGIGGLALALGAQKSMENFVGGLSLIADQPIRVGDFCKVGDVTGTVEAIGMRSTRIRTVDHTVVTIPNGALSSNVIENFAHRKKFKFTAIIGLRYDTTPEQMRDILVKLRSLLHEHPKVYKDPARIRLQELGASSLNLDLFAYIHATDFEDFLEIREGILLQIMEVVNDSATDFSFPSQTLYLARDKGMGRDGQDMRREEAFRSL